MAQLSNMYIPGLPMRKRSFVAKTEVTPVAPIDILTGIPSWVTLSLSEVPSTVQMELTDVPSEVSTSLTGIPSKVKD